MPIEMCESDRPRSPLDRREGQGRGAPFAPGWRQPIELSLRGRLGGASNAGNLAFGHPLCAPPPPSATPCRDPRIFAPATNALEKKNPMLSSFTFDQMRPPRAAGADGMDETTRGHTTTVTRAERTRRMLDCLREGWGYRDVASMEGLSERRVRQIVGAHVRRSQPVDEDIHAALQIERLEFAVKMAGEALAKGDVRAIAPYIKAIDRLDAYQTRARKAAPQPSQQADALVVEMLVDRIRLGVEAEMAAAKSPGPAAAPDPGLEAEAAPPPDAPESPAAAEGPAAAPPLAGSAGRADRARRAAGGRRAAGRARERRRRGPRAARRWSGAVAVAVAAANSGDVRSRVLQAGDVEFLAVQH